MTKTKKYKAHCENLRTIEIAIDEIERSLKDSIKKNECDKEIVYTRLFSFLIGCWIDVRLSKLINEPGAYSDNEVKTISSKGSLTDSWLTAIRIATSKKCGIKQIVEDDEIITRELTFTIKNMYRQILVWVDEYLRDMYEIRNKIAHGQWIKAFNTNQTEFSSDRTRDIKLTNIVSLQLKRSVLKEITYLLESLCISNVPKNKVKGKSVFEQTNTAFEKNFEKTYKKINYLLDDRQADRDYNVYKKNMIEKYQRGKGHKHNNVENVKMCK